jgi:tetratricopeptide (TPR) repeat protein
VRKTILFAMLVLGASLHAQQNFFYPKPEPGRIAVHKDLEYLPGLKADIYRPAGNETVPIMIFANIGSMLYTGWPIYIGWGEAVANAGMAGVVYQAHHWLGDFDALMDALRANASRLNIDPSRVVIWSASANVQAGLPLLMDSKRTYIKGGVIYYGDAEVTNIRTDLPVLFVRAGLDGTALNERIDKLIGRALAANAPWTIENYGGGLHGFESLNDNEITRALIDRTLSFARLVTRPEMTRAYASSADDASVGAAFARGEWKTAVDGYRRRIAANANDGEGHLRLGIALFRSGQPAEGLPMIEKAWELGRRGPRDVAMPAAYAAAGARNLPRALHWLDVLYSTPFAPPIAELRTAPELAPIRDEAAFTQFVGEVEERQRIAIALDSDSRGAAIEALRNAKGGRITREAVLLGMAYRLLTRGHKADAVEVFRIAASRYPASANAWESLSEAYEAAGATADAVTASRKALDLVASDQTLSDTMRESVRRGAADRIERLSGRG